MARTDTQTAVQHSKRNELDHADSLNPYHSRLSSSSCFCVHLSLPVAAPAGGVIGVTLLRDLLLLCVSGWFSSSDVGDAGLDEVGVRCDSRVRLRLLVCTGGGEMNESLPSD